MDYSRNEMKLQAETIYSLEASKKHYSLKQRSGVSCKSDGNRIDEKVIHFKNVIQKKRIIEYKHLINSHKLSTYSSVMLHD